jgi:hypothetical protein
LRVAGFKLRGRVFTLVFLALPYSAMRLYICPVGKTGVAVGKKK